MSERPPRASTSAPSRISGLVSRAWWRADQYPLRAYDAARQLATEVAQWEPGTGLDIVLASIRGEARLGVTPFGLPQPYWVDGVRHALRNVVTMSSGLTRPVPAGRLVEIVRNPLRAYPEVPSTEARSETETELQRLASLSRTPATVWPTPHPDAGAGFFDALLLQRGSYVRFLMSPAESIEQWMVQSSMRTTFTHVDGWEFDNYLGTPIRLRVFVGGDPAVSATLRAAVLSWGTGLRAVPVDPAEAGALAAPTADHLAGHVVPTTMALSMLRIPAVGTVPQPGVASELPRPRVVPLDPMPRAPRRPIRLGSAVNVRGKRVSVSLDASDLTRHTFIEGRTGAGKTTFIAELIAELSRAGIGYTLLDLHGAGVDAALRTADTSQRTIVVRHSDTAHPVPVNLLAEPDGDRREQVLSEFAQFIQKKDDPRQEGIVGPRWTRAFLQVAEGTCDVFGTRASLVHIAAILSDPVRIQQLSKALRTTNPDLANRLASEFGQLNSSEAANITSWVVSKFAPFTSSRVMRAILGTGLDAVDVDAVMEGGAGLLVDLGGPTLGTMQAQVLGAIWLLKHWLAMGRRSDVSRPHVIIVDEAHLFTYGALPQLLAESRKFGIGLVLATQSIDQLPRQLEQAIEANVGTHVSLRLSPASAARASIRFGGWPVEQFVRLPDLTAIASINRGGRPTDPFTLELDHYGRSRRLGRINDPNLVQKVHDSSQHHLWEVTKTAVAPTDVEITRTLRVEATRSAEPPRSAIGQALDEWLAGTLDPGLVHGE